MVKLTPLGLAAGLLAAGAVTQPSYPRGENNTTPSVEVNINFGPRVGMPRGFSGVSAEHYAKAKC